MTFRTPREILATERFVPPEQWTPEQRSDIREAERKAAADVRKWKRQASAKLNRMDPHERVVYLNEQGARFLAEHGVTTTVR